MWIVEVKNKYGNCIMASFRNLDDAINFGETIVRSGMRYHNCKPVHIWEPDPLTMEEVLCA